MYEFITEGMTCQGCVGAVTNAVKEIDPSAEVKVDLETQKVHVKSFQAQGVLTAAIEEAGYPIREARSVSFGV